MTPAYFIESVFSYTLGIIPKLRFLKLKTLKGMSAITFSHVKSHEHLKSAQIFKLQTKPGFESHIFKATKLWLTESSLVFQTILVVRTYTTGTVRSVICSECYSKFQAVL